eukprot:1409891-Rhodomonas_salina.3
MHSQYQTCRSTAVADSGVSRTAFAARADARWTRTPRVQGALLARIPRRNQTQDIALSAPSVLKRR